MDTDQTQMIKYLQPFIIQRRRKNKTRRMDVIKRNYPIVASMMPIQMNTHINQPFLFIHTDSTPIARGLAVVVVYN